MFRIVFELVLLVALIGAGLSAARSWDRRHQPALPPPEPPAGAVWKAVHRGTSDDRTEVMVVLRGPRPSDVRDQRRTAVIANQDPDYDRLLYNAIEDARARATLLNNLRDD